MFLIPKDSWTIKKSGKKGKGVFATKNIKPGVIIGDYLGKVIRMEDEAIYDKGGKFYSMYYSDSTLIYPVSVKKDGMHLFNHSCTPNTWMYTYKGHTLYFALRNIFPDEELTVSYLLSPLDKECKPCTHLCSCQSIMCYGTMHLTEKRYEKWEVFHENQEKATKPEKVIFGQELQKLESYPKNIPDDKIYPMFGNTEKEAETVDNDTLPSISSIRKMIRTSGKTIKFEKLNIKVLGVLDNLIISENL